MIDQHTLSVLEFPKVRRLIADGATSVYGREAIEASVPSIDVDVIRRNLALADEMAAAVRWGDPVPMGGVRDIRDAIGIAGRYGARLDPSALLNIADTVRALGRLRSHFSSRKEKYPAVWGIASAIADTTELASDVDRVIDPGGFVKDSASAKLARIRRDLDQDRQSLRAGLDRLVNRLGDDIVGDRIVSVRDGRLVIPIRATQKGSVPGIVHDQSASGQTLFVEPIEAVEQANHIRSLELEERQEVERILEEITSTIREYVPRLEANITVVTELDRLYAIAAFADRVNGVAPRMGEGKTFELVEMRHPLLDIRLRQESGDGAVPVTARLRDDMRLVIVSGPNAGGKTVALKTIGLACAMAQAGFLIPANHLTVLPVFRAMFAEIGDEQSIEQDLSTFSSRMRNMAKISDNADADTLVLVDELGSATDPEQGAALSRALLKHWADRGALVFATTHLGALKEFAHEHPLAVNASMEFDRETLGPTFRLHIGIPGSSYALEISRRVGLSPELIAEAEKDLGDTVVRTEELIAELTTRLENAREAEWSLERRERELGEREEEYAKLFAKVNADRKRAVREAREEAEKILGEARSLVERTVAELRETNASRDAVKQARHDIQESLAKTREHIARSRPKREKPAEPLEIGDYVRVSHLGLKGELVALDRNRGAIQTDNARMEVPVEQIERVEGAAKRAKLSSTGRGGVTIQTSVPDTFKSEIDVRGMTFDEAWDAVDRYLDDAVLARYPRVRIIHGKGTGVLRKRFAEQLATDPRSAKFQLGELHEGGTGVTVVDIRC